MSITTRQHVAPAKASRVIRCTADNAKQFQQIVKNDPELLNLVQSLQAQNLFPGLRAMTITITGSPEVLAKGLDAWPTT